MYGFSVTVSGTVDETVPRVAEELKKEGFGVLTEIDAKKVLKEKLDLDRRPYRILGACNPSLAHQALDIEPNVGLLLPCNVVVREEEDGSTTVAFMDPITVVGIAERKELRTLAEDARARLERVRDALKA